MSSPGHPESNGHAEAAVKTVKKLVTAASQKGTLDDEQLDQGLLEIRNTPRADGRSPAQILFGHPVRTPLPVHHRAFAPQWQRLADDCDARLMSFTRTFGGVTTDAPVLCRGSASAAGWMSRIW